MLGTSSEVSYSQSAGCIEGVVLKPQSHPLKHLFLFPFKYFASHAFFLSFTQASAGTALLYTPFDSFFSSVLIILLQNGEYRSTERRR
jgi:hypothetical protein